MQHFPCAVHPHDVHLGLLADVDSKSDTVTSVANADNSLDDKLSVITIFVPQRQERLPRNALLEIASCINGGLAS